MNSSKFSLDFFSRGFLRWNEEFYLPSSKRAAKSSSKIHDYIDTKTDCDHDSFGAFPSYEAKRRLEIRFRVERKLRFLRGVDSEEFMNVFMRIGFGSTIELVSFDKGQVVTFDSKFVCGFREHVEWRNHGVGETTWSAAHYGFYHPLARNFEENIKK
ncbi:hypothetical protein Tco_1284711 [Tanacetum coccineum]